MFGDGKQIVPGNGPKSDAPQQFKKVNFSSPWWKVDPLHHRIKNNFFIFYVKFVVTDYIFKFVFVEMNKLTALYQHFGKIMFDESLTSFHEIVAEILIGKMQNSQAICRAEFICGRVN